MDQASDAQIEWPQSYSYQDISRALLHFADTNVIDESTRITTFSKLVAKRTGSSDILRLPEPFNRSPYLVRLVDKISTAKAKLALEVFHNSKQVIDKLKEFISSIAARNSDITKIIAEESSPLRASLLSDPKRFKDSCMVTYYTSGDTDRYDKDFERMTYCLTCLIWGGQIDGSLFKDSSETEKRFLVLQKFATTLNERDKTYMIDLLRQAIFCLVAIFMVHRTNVFFRGGTAPYHFSIFFRPMEITRLKELIVFDKNPFILEDGTEIPKKTPLHSKKKAEIGYDAIMQQAFGKYIIDSSTL